MTYEEILTEQVQARRQCVASQEARKARIALERAELFDLDDDPEAYDGW